MSKTRTILPQNLRLRLTLQTVALMLVDQVPANTPSLTGADVPRILGRITPGSPLNWHHVLAAMSQTLPEKLPLRNAI